MAYTVKRAEGGDAAAAPGETVQASDAALPTGGMPPSHTASLEEAVGRVVRTMPRMFRVVKHNARTSEASSHATEYKDLGEQQMWVLHSLARGPMLTSELARMFNVATPTMTRIIDGLVERGYVERTPDAEDRRRIILHATEMGCKVGEAVHSHFRMALAGFLSPLDAEQLDDIARACSHIATLLPIDSFDPESRCPVRAVPGQGGPQSNEGE